MKRFTLVLLCLIMTVSLMATSVSAALSTAWINTFADFPVLDRHRDNDLHFTKALQRYLMCFDNMSKSLLVYNNRYMDGDFGGRTEDALMYVQEELGERGDGICGELTWTAIARDLDSYALNSTKNIFRRWLSGANIYQEAPGYGTPNALCYYDEDGSIIMFAQKDY